MHIGEQSMLPLVLNLDIFTTPGEEPRYRLNRRLSRPDSRSECFVEMKALGLTGFELRTAQFIA
jgi:hypothetical protein